MDVDAWVRERWVPEEGGNPERGPFERDRARVLHSAALRRLAAKTQVVTGGADEGLHSPRTRLTHSLECAQIGRELGKALGCDPDLVETACLAHDLGHPPFGHNGEAALDEVAAPCGGFEGNAQSLRLLTRLEAKVVAADGRSVGLNLTRGSLDASLKYPWTKERSPKYGVYAEDLDVFRWIRDGRGDDGRVRFEAQVMDWSDDVAYSVHDLEDTLHSVREVLPALRDPAERRDVRDLAVRWYAPDASAGELDEAFEGLLREPFWPEAYDGSMGSLAALKNLTSELIGRFCRAAQHATEEAGTRGVRLVVPRRTRLECALLKGVTARYVMTTDEHHARQARQRELIFELAGMVEAGAPETLDPSWREAYGTADGDAARLRVVVDQLASLTDVSAVELRRRLSRRR
ncbi:deoxyguanosinetriphosphate triphosphohydrolase [Bailinhaonella thermotolerans]|uniref:Deoxyguanosinetriphosphate triphosphohydrolase n=1 Tax=Bailinhaonella thermotolerans TaxID=1070861 RepID=A0A3A4A288_9ACTN|nr:deoxyguanosinetriphosphate triphosphohydrolase [Bailinhaonella thermotolerans]RJL21459.1 deoxyguanosinetriphosphate triphosphohydrolase [Bailinhaonella thermotolerans]